MTPVVKPAPVRKSVTVRASPARAFETFTAGFARWWPPSHSIGSAPMVRAVIEPRVGGRWYEIGEDGSECDWGEVLAWEPPQRLLLAWRLGADWRYDPKLLTEVEIRFVGLNDTETRVELEHRLLENMGAIAEQARQAFDADGGWGGMLAAYRAEVEKT